MEHRVAQIQPGLLRLTIDEQAPPATWPSVSLCMIVKNEEENLAACLESVDDFPSEMIIVDTGSTDRTVEIAHSFGAQVRHFNWINDFAAARNESIKYATSDWIFWLDADDRIRPEELVRLKNLIASGLADAYRCRMVSPLAGENQAVNTVYYTLLFRNRLGLQFEGPVHESVTEAIIRRGLTVAYTNVSIEHVGYSGDPELLRQKARRNERILRKCIEQEPDNLKWCYHLGLSLYQLEDYLGAIEQLEAVINHPLPTLNADSHLYRAYVLLMSACTTVPDIFKAKSVLQRALDIFPNRRHLWTTAGMFYLTQNDPEPAVAMLERAQTLPVDSDFEGEAWAEGVLEEQLAAAYQACGMKALQGEDYEKAAIAFDTMIQLSPPANQAAGYKLLAVAFQKLGHQEEALVCWQAAQHLAA